MEFVYRPGERLRVKRCKESRGKGMIKFFKKSALVFVLIVSGGGMVRAKERGSGKTLIVKVRGTRLRVFAESARYHPNGELQAARLYGTAKLSGLLVKDGVEFTSSGRLQSASLARDTRLIGFVFRGETTIQFHKNGNPAYGDLAKDTLLGGVPALGYPRTTFFYSSGKLRSAYLSRAVTVSGYPLSAGSLIELTEAGNLYSGRLSEDFKVKRGLLPSGTTVYMGTKGALERAYLSGPTRIEGTLVGGESHGDKQIRFHPDGGISMAVSAAEQRIGKVMLPKGDTFYVSACGDIITIQLRAPYKHRGIVFSSSVIFSRSGRLIKGRLHVAQKINDVILGSHYEVEFHPNGRLASGLVGEPSEVQGIKVQPGTVIEFHPNGRLHKVVPSSPFRIKGLWLTRSGRIQIPTERGPTRYRVEGVTFYPSGRVKSGYLAKTAKISKLLIRGGENGFSSIFPEATRIELHPNGRLKKGFLAQNHVIDGITLFGCPDNKSCGLDAPKAAVEVSDRGRLVAGYPSQDTIVSGVFLAEKRRFELYPDGRLRKGESGKRQKISNLDIPRFLPLRFDKRGELDVKRLRSRSKIGRLTLEPKTIVMFDESKRLQWALLDREHDVLGFRFKAGTVLVFDQGDSLRKGIGLHHVFLSSPHKIRSVHWTDGTRLFFDREGRINYAIPGGKQEIYGLTMKEGAYLDLYPSGRPKEGRLARDVALDGVRFKKGETIHLYSNGRPREGALKKKRRILGFTLNKGDTIHDYHPSGRLAAFYSAQERVVANIRCGTGTPVSLYENGRLKSCYLAVPSIVSKIPLNRGMILFHENGRLKEASLSGDVTVSNFRLLGGTVVQFHPNGVLESGYLAGNQIIGGKKYQYRTRVHFNNRGKLVSAKPYFHPKD